MKKNLTKVSIMSLIVGFVMTASTVMADVGWRFNFTPALVSGGSDYNLGWGVDPELRYGFSLGVASLSIGARTGAYYVKNLFGIVAMPTVRLTVPFDRLDTYVALGVGAGWIPKLEDSNVTKMYRAGCVYHFNEKVGVGIEGTYQEMSYSDFRFLSMGSMISFGL